MIGYITIGAVDIEQAKTFYDSVLGTIGWQQFADYGDPIGYAQNDTGDGQTIWICKPFDGEAPRAGNRIMVGFDADTKDQVTPLHAAQGWGRGPARPRRRGGGSGAGGRPRKKIPPPPAAPAGPAPHSRPPGGRKNTWMGGAPPAAPGFRRSRWSGPAAAA